MVGAIWSAGRQLDHNFVSSHFAMGQRILWLHLKQDKICTSQCFTVCCLDWNFLYWYHNTENDHIDNHLIICRLESYIYFGIGDKLNSCFNYVYTSSAKKNSLINILTRLKYNLLFAGPTVSPVFHHLDTLQSLFCKQCIEKKNLS